MENLEYALVDDSVKEVLVISDLHFNNYYFNNPAEDKRRRFITQPLKLAERINSIAKQKGIRHLFVLGDCFDKQISESRIIEACKSFFKHLDKDLYKIVILGQHDINSKIFAPLEDPSKNDYIDEDTLMKNIIELPNINMLYAHNKYLKLGGRTFYLSDWTGKTTINEPKVPVDVFMSHVLLDFIDLKECLPLVDNYKLAIHGDIHMKKEFLVNTTRIYSVGVPYQHDLKCDVDGNIVGLNLETLEVTRIPTDTPEFEFLKFYAPERNLTPDEEQKVIEVTHSLTETIDRTVSELSLDDVHNEIMQLSGKPEMIDFNFKVTRLLVENFKSIKQLELDFTSRGLTYVCGRNGSGKSSLLEALKLALIGDSRVINTKANDSDPKNKVRLEVDLTYKGIKYTIVRGTDLRHFYIDGVEKSTGNKKGVDEIINETLPFLKYMDMFFVPANNHFFTQDKREQLIKVCFNLGIFDFLFDSAKELKKEYNSKANLLSGEVKGIESSLDSIRESYDALRMDIKDTAVTYSKEELEKYSKEYKDLFTSRSNLIHLIEQLQVEKSQCKLEWDSLDKSVTYDEKLHEDLKSQLNSLNAEIAVLTKDHSLEDEIQKFQDELAAAIEKVRDESDREKQDTMKTLIGDLSEKRADFQSTIEDCRQRLQKLRDQLSKKEYEGKDKKKQLDNLISEKDSGVCPTCGQNMPAREGIDDLIAASKDELQTVRATYKKIAKDISDIEISIKDQSKTVEDLSLRIENVTETVSTQYKSKLESKISEIESSSKIELDKLLAEQAKKREHLQTYLDQSEDISSKCSKLESIKDAASNMIALENKMETILKNIAHNTVKLHSQMPQETELCLALQVNEFEMVDKRLTDLISDIAVIESKQVQLDSLFATIQTQTAELKQLKATCADATSMYTKTCAYIDLFDPNRLDSIPYKVLNDITEVFKVGSLSLTTNYSTKTTGKDKFKISCCYDFGNGKSRDYDSASDGQKCVMDFEILKRLSEILQGLGLVILDESLSNLDTENYEIVIESLITTIADNILVSSFSHNFTNYNSLIEVGIDKGESFFTEGF